MAYILRVYILDAGDRMIKVEHDFFGTTLAEADTYYKEHLGSCEYFAAAVREDRVIEEVEEVDADELPSEADFEEEEEEEG
jgi:hypothetical protein